MNNDESNIESGLALAAGIAEERINDAMAEYDEYYHLLFLLYSVNEFQPRDKWITPILESRECQDLKLRLMVAIEDYEEDG